MHICKPHGPRVAMQDGNGNPGFSLVEVLVAAGILACLAYSIITSLVGTARSGKRAADLFTEAVVARYTMSQLKNAIDFDPEYLAHLDTDFGFRKENDSAGDAFSTMGTVVNADPPIDTPLGRVGQLPLLAGGFGDVLRSAGPGQAASLVQSAATALPDLSADELAQLAASLSDFVVTIRLANFAKPLDHLGVTYGERNLRELIKQVTICVYHLSDASRSHPWTPAYTTTERILTPIESLSQDAVFDLTDSTRLVDARPIVQEAIRELKEQTTLAPYDDATMELAARLFLVFQEVNTEAFLTEGKALVAAPGIPPDVQGIDQQIALLQGATSGYLQQRLGFLHERKALTIFQTFKRVSLLLDDLTRKEDELKAEVVASRAQGEALLAKAVDTARGLRAAGDASQIPSLAGDLRAAATSYVQYLDSARSLIARARLMEYLLTDPQFTRVRDRLAAYPDRMAMALDAAAQVFGRLADGGVPSISIQAKAVAEWFDLAKAMRLLNDGAAVEPSVAARMASLGKHFESLIPPVADDIKHTALRDALSTLKLRYPAFVEALPSFTALSGPGNPALVVQADYGDGREVSTYLNVLGAVPSAIDQAAWTLAWTAGRLQVSQGQFDDTLASVNTVLKDATAAAIGAGLTTPAIIEAYQIPEPSDRRQIAGFATAVTAALQGATGRLQPAPPVGAPSTSLPLPPPPVSTSGAGGGIAIGGLSGGTNVSPSGGGPGVSPGAGAGGTSGGTGGASGGAGGTAVGTGGAGGGTGGTAVGTGGAGGGSGGAGGGGRRGGIGGAGGRTGSSGRPGGPSSLPSVSARMPSGPGGNGGGMSGQGGGQ